MPNLVEIVATVWKCIKIKQKNIHTLFFTDIIHGNKTWTHIHFHSQIIQNSGYTSYFKETWKNAKYGRNARGLAVYVMDDISKRVTEIWGKYESKFMDRIREDNSSYLGM
jgi:hypothetical protein